jgi:hypothetical protein
MTKRILVHFQVYWILIVLIKAFRKTSFIHKYSAAKQIQTQHDKQLAPPHLYTNEFEPKTFFNEHGPIQGFFIESSSLGTLI